MARSCCSLLSSKDESLMHQEWMKNLPVELCGIPISRLAIPGSHDSFAFHLSNQPGPDLDAGLRRFYFLILPVIKRWSLTQENTFTKQLNLGIRYFDLRVCRTLDQQHAHESPFSFTHGLQGDLVRPALEEINRFLDAHRQEIVLLDFNHFYDFSDQCGHEQLLDMIHQVFGSKLCTTSSTIEQCTLNYLWSQNQQVILLYEENPDKCSIYMDRVGHFFKICQSPWPNTASVNDLFVFLDKCVSQPRSTSCINVVQGQITPDSAAIQRNPFSSLLNMANETNQRLLQWLANRKRDPELVDGVNVVICDFVDQHFTNAVIMLNYRSINE